jgi:hypothetical protein
MTMVSVVVLMVKKCTVVTLQATSRYIPERGKYLIYVNRPDTHQIYTNLNAVHSRFDSSHPVVFSNIISDLLRHNHNTMYNAFLLLHQWRRVSVLKVTILRPTQITLIQ